ncbi:GspE/PulE family protein [uncultured Clostridium sp.]|uniref:GspE/PulE family protein n=1 Tax=uncultured Clostridium sp. TaxID=59620 RepID=UPI0026163CF8|nr:GspE/PulE family protein [uncultured Clostridium sp.]
MSITREIVDSKSMRRIPKTMANKLNLVIGRDESDTLIAFTDKVTVDKKLYLNLVFSREVAFKEIDKRKIATMLKEYNDDRDKFLMNDNYVEKELDKLIESAIDKGSSDIHIEPEKYYANIRYRVNGDLVFINRLSKEEYHSIINRIKVLASMDIANRLEPQDGKMSVKLVSEVYDVRVSSIPTTNGEKIVLRILYKDESLNRIEKLNFDDEQLETVNRLLQLKKGMIIVNGPTGSGKSTTLYACLNKLDKNKLNICTVEDPVEFDLENITQSNVNERVGFNFHKALKYILRQDPDVILVGEIRDEQTAKMATRSAITGHKVLSTIHTSTGNEVYYRLLNMGVDKYLLDEALVGIITQRLIKVLCDECKEEHRYEIDGKQRILYRNIGCPMCNGTGYSRRTVVAEVIDLTKYKKGEVPWGKQIIKSLRRLLLDGKITFEDYILFKESEDLSD